MPASCEETLSGARALALYVDGLWSVPLRIVSLHSDDERPRTILARAGARPVLHLPPGDRRHHLACIAHSLAHLVHGGPAQARAHLKPVQRVLLETLEDARVEWLAMQALPGLRRLWTPFHAAAVAERGLALDALLMRLSRALFDPEHRDEHAWITRVQRMFFSADGGLALRTPEALREVASRLGNDIGQLRLGFDAAGWRSEPGYRDDNHHLWLEDATLSPSATALEREACDSHGCGEPGEAPLERPPPEPTAGAEQGLGGAAALWAEAPLRSLKYPEWDRLIACLRPDWCTVIESRPLITDASSLRTRLRRALRRRRAARRDPTTGPPGSGRAQEGAALQADALLEAGIALRARRMPPARLYRAVRAQERRRDILLLLDASASTAAACEEGGTVLDCLREAALLLAHELEGRGHLVRLWGFASDTRHRVRVQHLKGIRERALEPRVCARAAGLRSHGSTRLGTVLRHALAHPVGERPLVLLFTDGEAHDIDIHDPCYLKEDMKQVLRAARRLGTAVRFLDPGQVNARALPGSSRGGFAAATR